MADSDVQSDTTNRELVFDVCNNMYAAGEKVSVRIIQSQLPSIKSTSTVHKYYGEWKKEIEANAQSLYDKLGFSPEFIQSFNKEISRFRTEAEQRHKKAANDSEEQCRHAIDELAKVEERYYKQEAIVEQQAKEIEKLEADIKSEINDSKSTIDANNQGYEATISELRDQLTAVTQNHTQALQESSELRTELAKAQLKIDTNQSYVDDVKQQLTESKETITKLNEGLSKVSSELSGVKAELSGSVRLYEQLTVSNQRVIDDNVKLEKKITISETELKAASVKNDEHVKVIQQLEAKIKEQAALIEKFTPKK